MIGTTFRDAPAETLGPAERHGVWKWSFLVGVSWRLTNVLAVSLTNQKLGEGFSDAIP